MYSQSGMKKVLFFIVWFISVFYIGAQEKYRIAIFDLQYHHGIESYEAEQISEIIRTQIIITDAFKVLEKSQVDKLMKETGFQFAGLVDESTIVEFGKASDIKFLITGAMGRLFDRISITARLVSTETGENLFSEELLTNEVSIFRDLDRFAKKIANKMVELTYGITIENINKFVEMGDFESAYRRMRIYLERGETDGRVGEFEERIDLGLAEHLYEKADLALSRELYEEAAGYCEQLLRLVPDNDTYLRFTEQVYREYEEYKERKREELLKEVRRLIRKGHLGEARKALDDYVGLEGAAVQDEEFTELYTRLEEEKAKEAYRFSRAYLKEGSYDESLESIAAAVKLRPENKEYIDFIDTIHNRMEYEVEKTYNRIVQRERFFSFGPRNPFTVQTAGVLRFFRDPYRELGVSGTFPGVEVDMVFFSRFLDPLQITYIITGTFVAGTGEQTFETSQVQNRFWMPDIEGGIGLASTLAYMDFGLSISGHAALMRRNIDRVVFGVEEREEDFVFLFGPAASFWASYYLTDWVQFFFRYKISWMYRFGSRTLRAHTLGLGAGISF
jgi:tetratricopeptide (TPR) repeat protein